MNVKLVIEKGRTRVREIKLRAEETVVGRAKGCELRIPSAEVSRRHCLLSTQPGYLTAEDLDSVNGTFVNGKPVVGKQPVRPGDRLKIGPLTFVVEYQLTQAALEQMVGEEVVAEVVEDEAEEAVVELVEEDPNDAPLKVDFDMAANELADLETDGMMTLEDDDAALDAVVDLDDKGNWQLPDGGELRDILSQLEGDRKPSQDSDDE